MVNMKIVFAILLIALLLHGDAGAWTHGVVSSGFIIQAPSDFLLDNSSGKLIAG